MDERNDLLSWRPVRPLEQVETFIQHGTPDHDYDMALVAKRQLQLYRVINAHVGRYKIFSRTLTEINAIRFAFRGLHLKGLSAPFQIFQEVLRHAQMSRWTLLDSAR